MTQATMVNSGGAARRGFKRLAAGMLLAVSASVALSVWARPGAGEHHGGGMGGPGLFMGSPEHMDRAVDHMLEGLNATDAQRSRIKQIAQLAAQDLKPQREAGRGLHGKAAAIFTAPSVDPAAAESVRLQMLAQHDQVSRRVLQAMIEISGVLTPEQRAKIGEKMKQRSAKMHERMQQRMDRSKQ